MKTKIKILSLLFFLILASITVPFVHKAKAEIYTVANVEIYDPVIISQVGNKYKLAFDIFNGEGVQAQVKYGIQLVGKVSYGSYVADEKIFDETLTLKPNGTLHKEVEYAAPEFLQGNFDLKIVSKNSNGLPLGINSFGETRLNGSGQFVEVSSCQLSVGGLGDKYTLTQGVDILPSENLYLKCKLENRSGSDYRLQPFAELYRRSIFGKMLSSMNSEEIALAANESKTFDFAVPKGNIPQAYDVSFYLKNAGKVISNKVLFHYVLHGESATIQNLRFDKESYKSGETAKVFFVWTPRSDIFPGARIMEEKNQAVELGIEIKDGSGKSCSEKFQKKLVSDTDNFEIPINSDCAYPRIMAELTNGEGKVLDSLNFGYDRPNIKSVKVSKESESVDKTPFMALALIIAFIPVLFFGYKKFKTRFLVLMIFIIGGTVSFSGMAEAVTVTIDSVVHDIKVNTTYNVNLNKSTYSPGEEIVINASVVNGICNNGDQNFKLDIVTPITGTRNILAFWGVAGGGSESNSIRIPAPNREGSFDLKFIGYGWYVDGTNDTVRATQEFAVPFSVCDWKPLQSDVCYGQTFTQTSFCGSRTVTGLKPCPDLVANPENVTSGNSTILSWKKVEGADSCSSSGNWSGSKNPSGASEVVVPAATGSSYTLTCSNPFAYGSDTVNIGVCQDTTWTPDSDSYCSSQEVTQTSNCGTTRKIWGTNTGTNTYVCEYVPDTCTQETCGRTLKRRAYCRAYNSCGSVDTVDGALCGSSCVDQDIACPSCSENWKEVAP